MPLKDVRTLLDDPAAAPDDRAEPTDGDHGRIEIRRVSILDIARAMQLAVADLPDFRRGTA